MVNPETVPAGPRRQIQRTGVLIADPRLEPARASLGERLVKQAIPKTKDRVRNGEIGVEYLIDEVLARLPPTASSVVTRVEPDRCLLELRCVPGKADALVRGAIREAQQEIAAESRRCT